MGEWAHRADGIVRIDGQRCVVCHDPWPCDAEQQRLRADAEARAVNVLQPAYDAALARIASLLAALEREAEHEPVVRVLLRRMPEVAAARSALEASAVPTDDLDVERLARVLYERRTRGGHRGHPFPTWDELDLPGPYMPFRADPGNRAAKREEFMEMARRIAGDYKRGSGL